MAVCVVMNCANVVVVAVSFDTVVGVDAVVCVSVVAVADAGADSVAMRTDVIVVGVVAGCCCCCC